jgi:hypothetical protein
MKFICNEIQMGNQEFGCTITFSENMNNGISEEKLTFDEIIDSIGTYIMLQRTYAEDEFEEDYCYFESSDPEKSGEIENFEINLSRNQFVLNFEKEVYDIELNLDTKIFEKLKENLKIITCEIVKPLNNSE